MSVRAELDCDAVVRGFPGLPKPHVQPFSYIKPEVPDIPDRRYYLRGVAMFWEIKLLTDKFTEGQYAFLEREYNAGCLVGAGDAADLQRLIYSGPPSTWRKPGWDLILAIKERGWRK